MSLLTACQRYVENKDKNGDIILVALSEHLDSGLEEDAVKLLLQNKFKNVLVDLGWDIFSVLTPRLRSCANHVTWTLVQRIVEGGSPKEMCLAILEQMEALSASEKTAVMFNMLHYLQGALQGTKQEAIMVSTLHSVFRLTQLHCPQLSMDERDSVTVEMAHSTSKDSEAKVTDQGRESEGQDGHVTLTPQSGDQEEEQESNEGRNFFAVSSKVMIFVRPFVERFHYQAIQPTEVRHERDFWEQKIKCISILLCLLDYPLVNCTLKVNKKEGPATPTRALGVASSVMSLIVKCHYGCVQLLSCQYQSSDPSEAWSGVGVASFAHLILVEEVEANYLPAVLSPRFLLLLSLSHVKTLLERPEPRVILKGLTLLEKVTSRVQRSTLSVEELENQEFVRVANVLTNIMVSCSNKKARKKGLSLLLSLVNSFTATGRHKLYTNLLHTVTHSGVMGLLIHGVKNEVDSALKIFSSESESPFLGEKLTPLLKKILNFSPDTDLMEEMDKVMGSLNFLRYLLIRESPDNSKTGIWSLKAHIQEHFTAPVRQALTSTKMFCRQELEAKREVKGQMTREGPEVTVKVSGEKLPKLSEKEELQALHLACSHMDMLESVLVRVEELLDERT